MAILGKSTWVDTDTHTNSVTRLATQSQVFNEFSGNFGTYVNAVNKALNLVPDGPAVVRYGIRRSVRAHSH